MGKEDPQQTPQSAESNPQTQQETPQGQESIIDEKKRWEAEVDNLAAQTQTALENNDLTQYHNLKRQFLLLRSRLVMEKTKAGRDQSDSGKQRFEMFTEVLNALLEMVSANLDFLEELRSNQENVATPQQQQTVKQETVQPPQPEVSKPKESNPLSAQLLILEQKAIEGTEILRQVTEQDDNVRTFYDHIYKDLETLRKEHYGSAEMAVIIETEKKIRKAEYKSYRKSALDMIYRGEDVNVGASRLSKSLLELVFNGKILPRMTEDVHFLKKIQDVESQIYEDDLKELSLFIKSAALNLFTWATYGDDLLGTGFDRNPPKEGSTQDAAPIEGINIDYLIKEKLGSPEFGEVNPVIRIRDVEVNSWTTPEAVEKVELKETVMGFCMRIFDAVYEGRVPEAITAKGERISTRNLHNSFPELINFTYNKVLEIERENVKKEKELADKEGRKPRFTEPRVDELVVLRAFRLHLMTTLHQSFLAKGSVEGMADTIYYMFHWLEYMYKYAKDATNVFHMMQTVMLWNYEDFNPLELMFEEYDKSGKPKGKGKEKLRKVREVLQIKGLLNRENPNNVERFSQYGSTTFAWLLSPSIGVEDIEWGYLKNLDGDYCDSEGNVVPESQKVPRSNIQNFTPPLRFYTLKGNPSLGSFTDIVDFLAPNASNLRSPEKDGVGRILTMEDVRDVDGNYLYEKMPWGSMAPLRAYYNQLGKNLFGFFSTYLKAPRDKFLSTMNDIDGLKGIRNLGKYAMDGFPVASALIHGDESRTAIIGGKQYEVSFGEIVKNQIIAQLILEKCLLQMDTSKESKDRWNEDQLKAYLLSCSRERVISDECRIAIETIVLEGSKFEYRSAFIADELLTKLRKAFEYH